MQFLSSLFSSSTPSSSSSSREDGKEDATTNNNNTTTSTNKSSSAPFERLGGIQPVDHLQSLYKVRNLAYEHEQYIQQAWNSLIQLSLFLLLFFIMIHTNLFKYMIRKYLVSSLLFYYLINYSLCLLLLLYIIKRIKYLLKNPKQVRPHFETYFTTKFYKFIFEFLKSPLKQSRRILQHFKNVLFGGGGGNKKLKQNSSERPLEFDEMQKDFNFQSKKHALLGLKNSDEANDYDFYLYQEYQKQQEEAKVKSEQIKKENRDAINYDLIFNMDLSSGNVGANIGSSAGVGGVPGNQMMMNPFLLMDQQDQQQQQQEQQRMNYLPFNIPLVDNSSMIYDDSSMMSMGMGMMGMGMGGKSYRRAPASNVNEEFISNYQQLATSQQSNYQYAGNALLLGEQASQALELLHLTTFTVNNWSENMRKWMIHKVLIPTIKEIDSMNLQFHKTIQFNCDFKGYDMFNPLDISPEYQHSIPNSIPHTEDTSKFTLKYVLATLVTQIDQQLQQLQQQQSSFGSSSGGFGFSNGFNQQQQPQAQSQQHKNLSEFGQLLRNRLRLERYLTIPNLHLYDSTDKIACRKHVIDRLRAMSKGQFDKLSSRHQQQPHHLHHSEQYDQDVYPTDEEIIVNLFCKFMDFTLDSHGHSNQFSNKYYCDQTIEKKENPHHHGLFSRNRSMLAPAMKKKRGIEKQIPIKKGLYLCKSKVSLSHYNVEDDGSLYECQPGRNNVFYALVIFLHLINTKYDGYIDTVALSDLNLSQVIENYRQ